MCGIGSISFDPAVSGDVDLEAGIDALFHELESRGRDAAGFMAVRANGRVMVEKAAVKGSDFAFGRPELPGDTIAVGVHTRAATQGHEGWMKNNHPVIAGAAMVCHNGVVFDDWMERKLLDPEVDSFALAHQAMKVSERIEGQSLVEYAQRMATEMAEVDGSKAVILAIQGWPGLVITRLESNPLMVTNTVEGVVVAASTVIAVRKACEAMGLELRRVTQKVERTINNVKSESEETVDAIYAMRDGDLVAFESGVHVEGSIEVPEKPRYEKPVSSGRGWTNWQSGGGYTKPYGYGSGLAIEDFVEGDEVTMWSEHSPWHGQTGEVKEVLTSVLVVAFPEHDGKPAFKGNFAPSVIRFIDEAEEDKDEIEASTEQYASAVDAMPQLSQTTMQRTFRSASKAQKRKARERAEMIANSLPGTQSPARLQAYSALILNGWDSCDMCGEWSVQVETRQQMELCPTCTNQLDPTGVTAVEGESCEVGGA